MNKCEWKDGKFEPCDGFNGLTFQGGRLKENNCIVCHTDICKPEPKYPLIVKSGETLVMELDGKNYLCVFIGRFKTTDPLDIEEQRNEIIDPVCGVGCWKPFNEITLDDEIAKLRPMIMASGRYLKKLYGIDKLAIVLSDAVIGWEQVKECRLATAHELQESP